MSPSPPPYVLDTSALLTFIEDEVGADQVQELLEKAKRGEVILMVSFMSFMEVYYISRQERGQEEAQERVKLMAALPMLRVVPAALRFFVTSLLRMTPLRITWTDH